MVEKQLLERRSESTDGVRSMRRVVTRVEGWEDATKVRDDVLRFEDDDLEGWMFQGKDLRKMDVEDLEGDEVGTEVDEREETLEDPMEGNEGFRISEVGTFILVRPVPSDRVREVVPEESEVLDRLSLNVEERFEMGRNELGSADPDGFEVRVSAEEGDSDVASNPFVGGELEGRDGGRESDLNGGRRR